MDLISKYRNTIQESQRVDIYLAENLSASATENS